MTQQSECTTNCNGSDKKKRQLNTEMNSRGMTKRKRKMLRRETGEHFRLNIRYKPTRDTLTMPHLSNLVSYLLNGTNNHPDWVDIVDPPLKPKCVVLFIPGLEAKDFGLPEGSTGFRSNATKLLNKFLVDVHENNSNTSNDNNNSNTSNDNNNSNTSNDNDNNSTNDGNSSGIEPPFDVNKFKTLAVSAPASKISLYSPYNAFINLKLTNREKDELTRTLSRQKTTIDSLLMDADAFIENGYPIHPDTPGIKEKDNIVIDGTHEKDGWVDTKPMVRQDESNGNANGKQPPPPRKIFGIDCEMCKGETGPVLARVSIVNEEGMVVYDTFVEPEVPIIDYLTKYSGITAELMSSAPKKTLTDVQKYITNLISSHDIIVGHSLEHDFTALRLRHPTVIDTALIYDHEAGPPFRPSLKFLASTYLKKQIQLGEDKVGHDSIEDARTCIELLRLKLENNPGFGLVISTRDICARIGENGGKQSLLLNDSVRDNTNQRRHCRTIGCYTDGEIFDSIKEHINDYDLIVGRLRELEYARGYATRRIKSLPNGNNGGSSGVTDKVLGEKNDSQIIPNIIQQINKIYEMVPMGTLFMVVSGCGDTRELKRINDEINDLPREERYQKRGERRAELERAVLKAKDGVAIVLVKSTNGGVVVQ